MKNEINSESLFTFQQKHPLLVDSRSFSNWQDSLGGSETWKNSSSLCVIQNSDIDQSVMDFQTGAVNIIIIDRVLHIDYFFISGIQYLKINRFGDFKSDLVRFQNNENLCTNFRYSFTYNLKLCICFPKLFDKNTHPSNFWILWKFFLKVHKFVFQIC